MGFLVDPSDIIKYDRTVSELELFWLFCAVVAGKTATTQARLLDSFLQGLEGGTPFDRIQRAERRGTLLAALKASSLGQYNRLHRLMVDSLRFDLATCSVEDLETIHGVGPKTARMFVMMTRPDQEYAALDTHVLKHLRANGIDAPKATPPLGPTYRRLEQAFIALARSAKMAVADYDLAVWKQHSASPALA